MKTESNICPNCGSETISASRLCPTCKHDLGFPNVRQLNGSAHPEELDRRYKKAKEELTKRGISQELKMAENALHEHSGVVVALPANFARTFFENPRSNYQNYEELVSSGVLSPTDTAKDSHRMAVSGLLFGSFAKKILYGALSLTNQGLATYGEIFCRLKSAAIRTRTTFLENNSYVFVKKHNMSSDSSIPLGYSSTWDDRKKLAIAKLEHRFEKGMCADQFQKVLLETDSADRKNDEFIEAHIYDSFNANAVNSIEIADTSSASDSVKIDVRLAQDAFKQLSQ